MEPKVGEQFVQTISKPWTVEGRREMETEVLLCEITAIDAQGIDYRVVRAIEVTNPYPDGPSATTGGRMSFALFARRARPVQ